MHLSDLRGFFQDQAEGTHLMQQKLRKGAGGAIEAEAAAHGREVRCDVDVVGRLRFPAAATLMLSHQLAQQSHAVAGIETGLTGNCALRG